MRKHNIDNERVKREYLAFLKESAGRTEATLDIAAAAINRFEAFNKYRPFKAFRREQAISFKAHLALERSVATGKPLAKATLYGTLKAVRAFFEWLAREPGYRSLVFSDAAYFNLTQNDARVATAVRERPAPSVERVRHVLATMPAKTAVERRDRAVVALTLLTGARDAAVASLRLKHVDLNRRTVSQDAREVRTKRAKTFTTAFFPVGEDVEKIVADWIAELKRDHLFGHDDPIFPATRMGLDAAGLFSPVGLEREPWASTGPIREIFQKAFVGAGLPYAHPHSLRRTLTALGYERNLTVREMKAWSQNLGHKSVLTTLMSYGALQTEQQVEVMANLSQPAHAGEDTPEIAALIAGLRAVVKR